MVPKAILRVRIGGTKHMLKSYYDSVVGVLVTVAILTMPGVACWRSAPRAPGVVPPTLFTVSGGPTVHKVLPNGQVAIHCEVPSHLMAIAAAPDGRLYVCGWDDIVSQQTQVFEVSNGVVPLPINTSESIWPNSIALAENALLLPCDVGVVAVDMTTGNATTYSIGDKVREAHLFKPDECFCLTADGVLCALSLVDGSVHPVFDADRITKFSHITGNAQGGVILLDTSKRGWRLKEVAPAKYEVERLSIADSAASSITSGAFDWFLVGQDIPASTVAKRSDGGQTWYIKGATIFDAVVVP